MANEPSRMTGGCMCGAVRYEAAGAPAAVSHCHCESCRRHTGAPMVTLVSFEAGRVRFTKGERRIYNSSPGVGRAFCGDCGSPLTWESEYDGRSVIEFHVGTLDAPNAVTPAWHVYHDERLDWFDTADKLPRHHETARVGEPYLYEPAIKVQPG